MLPIGRLWQRSVSYVLYHTERASSQCRPNQKLHTRGSKYSLGVANDPIKQRGAHAGRWDLRYRCVVPPPPLGKNVTSKRDLLICPQAFRLVVILSALFYLRPLSLSPSFHLPRPSCRSSFYGLIVSTLFYLRCSPFCLSLASRSCSRSLLYEFLVWS